MKSLYKKYMFRLLANPFTYIISFVFVCFSVFQFFIGQQFFSEVGTTNLHRFFSVIPYACIIIIPAWCSIVPSEKNENSLPVSAFVIPVSKILALSTVALFSVVITFTVPVTVSFYGDIDMSQVVCGYAGILLFILTSLSFSVFIFTLTENPGASFVVSAMILAVVNSIHLLPMYFKLTPFLTALLREISFAWHFDSFGKGIIDSKDIIFYLCSIAVFPLCSVYVSERRRGNTYPVLKKFFVLSAAAFVLLIADSSIFYFRIDTTKNRQFTVSEFSKVLLSEVDEPMTITYYRTSDLKDLYPQVRDVDEFLRSYADENSMVTYSVVEPVKENIEARLETYGVIGQQLQTSGRNKTSYMTVYSGIVIDYLGMSETIPFVLSTANLEYDLSGRVQRLVRGSERFAQIVIGNSLDLDIDYSYIKPWLESQGFTVVQTYLPSQKNVSGKENSFTMLPQVPAVFVGTNRFKEEDVQALEEFIVKGGKSFIASVPYEIDLESNWGCYPVKTPFEYMMQSFGIYFRDTLTADLSNFRLTLTSNETTTGVTGNTKTQYINYSLWPVLAPQKNVLNGMTSFWPCAMEIDSAVSEERGFVVNPYLITSSNAWQSKSVEGMFITDPFYSSRGPEEGEERGMYNIAVSLSPKNTTEPSVIIVGDQYTFTNQMIAFSSVQTNIDTRSLDLLSDSLLRLCGEEKITTLKNRSIVNTTLYKKEVMNLYLSRTKTIVVLALIPLLVFAGIFAFVSYRRKIFNR